MRERAKPQPGGTYALPLFLASLALLAAGRPRPPAPATLVLRGGNVLTLDPHRPRAEAVAIRGEEIAAVGPAEEMEALIGPSTQLIDLRGRLALPGFNDSHIHLLSGGLSLFEVDLFDARSLADLQARIRAFAAANHGESWILGRGWRYTSMPEGRLPTRQDLDAAVADRPALMVAYDGHTGWANSKALALAGVTRNSRLQGYGDIVKDPETGEPSGVLKEGEAMGLVRRHVPQPGRERKLEALRQAMSLLVSLGTVSIQNASGDEDELGLYRELLERGELKLRVSMAMSVGRRTTDAAIGRIGSLAKEFAGPWLQVKGVKIGLDGVIESHTAAMLEPYSDQPSQSGTPVYSQAELDDLVLRCHRAGLQVLIHAIGDRAVRMALDAFEGAKSKAGRTDPRFRIEHIETISGEDIPRLKTIGVVASMQPIHADPDTVAVWSQAVGEARLKHAFAWRSLSAAGARLAFGTDWPASISVAPLRGIHNAVNRKTVEGKPPGGWIPSQRVSLKTALAGFTSEAAYASLEDGRRGSIEAGKLADLIVLSKELDRISPEEISTARPLLTIVGGQVVYRSAEF